MQHLTQHRLRQNQDMLTRLLNDSYNATKREDKSNTPFNPLEYLEDEELLTLKEYEKDTNFIQSVIENYQRLGLLDYENCIHNIAVRFIDTSKDPIKNKRAYIKSSLNKYKVKK